MYASALCVVAPIALLNRLKGGSGGVQQAFCSFISLWRGA
jgi:hypothetical protein